MRRWLEPGGSDATLRADGLAFLEALHEPGELELSDADGQRIAGLRLPAGARFDRDLREARRFVTEVAALEEWSGAKTPLPLEAGPAAVAEVARAAAMVRARVVPLTLGDELEVAVGTTAPDVSRVDTVVLPRAIWDQPFGIEIPLRTAEIVAPWR